MPAPTAYSELLFSDYLITVLGEVATVLGWDAHSPQVEEALNDALLEYGESDIGDITDSTDIRKFRALGRRAIWRAVVQVTAGNYSFTDVAQQKFERQQVNEQAREMLKLAEAECRALGADPAYVVSAVRVARVHDPYAVIPEEERVI